MSGQGEMFGQSYEGLRPITRNTDPSTSADAARILRESGQLNQQCLETLRALYAWKGAPPTSAELAGADTDARFRYARRLADLRELGLVFQCEPRRCRVSGRKALTWRVSMAGEERALRAAVDEARALEDDQR